jgi:hypothetical protein
MVRQADKLYQGISADQYDFDAAKAEITKRTRL